MYLKTFEPKPISLLRKTFHQAVTVKKCQRAFHMHFWVQQTMYVI